MPAFELTDDEARLARIAVERYADEATEAGDTPAALVADAVFRKLVAIENAKLDHAPGSVLDSGRGK